MGSIYKSVTYANSWAWTCQVLSQIALFWCDISG